MILFVATATATATATTIFTLIIRVLHAATITMITIELIKADGLLLRRKKNRRRRRRRRRKTTTKEKCEGGVEWPSSCGVVWCEHGDNYLSPKS